jgi:hypothetical protein
MASNMLNTRSISERREVRASSRISSVFLGIGGIGSSRSEPVQDLLLTSEVSLTARGPSLCRRKLFKQYSPFHVTLGHYEQPVGLPDQSEKARLARPDFSWPDRCSGHGEPGPSRRSGLIAG